MPHPSPPPLFLAYPPSRSQRYRRFLYEAIGFYILTVGITKLFFDLRAVLPLQPYLWTAAMLLQVYVPAWILYRHDLTIAHFGLHTRHWKRGLFWVFSLFLLFLFPSIYGHHLWQMALGRDTRPTISLYQLPEWLQGVPPHSQPHLVYFYAPPQQHNILVLRWQEPIAGVLQSDGLIRILDGLPAVEGPIYAREIRINGRSGAMPLSLRFALEGKQLSFRFTRNQRPLPTHAFRFGGAAHHLRQERISKDLFWLLQLILIQLLMVALPEEFFYRGYLLSRLDAIWPVRRFWGIPLSWGNLLSSILFAITHVLFGYQLYRLSVFFPSLLFGALRQHTGSLFAPILLHASFNLLMKFLELYYQ
jgi:membrane protease YdiL (CAAX protease family)